LSKISELLKDFHEKYSPVFAGPGNDNEHHWRVRNTRREILEEECKEYADAELANDFVGVADALGDLVYVAYGTALTYGIDLDAVIEEIHRSNMTKDMPEHVGGKAVKGKNYVAPDIRKVLNGGREG